ACHRPSSGAARHLLPASGAKDLRRSIVVGALCIVPLFVKQNIGLAFVAALVLMLIVERCWRVLAGLAVGAATAIALVAAIFGLGNYATWTLSFAAARRLPPIGMIV